MKKAADLIQSVLHAWQIDDSKGYGSFLRSWLAVVGSDLEQHCRPADIRRGVLLVEVDHPGWLQKFKMQEKAFLKQLQKDFPQLQIRRFGYVYVDFDSKNPQPVAQRLSGEEYLLIPAVDQPLILAEEPDSRQTLSEALERVRKTMEAKE